MSSLTGRPRQRPADLCAPDTSHAHTAHKIRSAVGGGAWG